MKSTEMLLDFGTIRTYEKPRTFDKKKTIVFTVYSNATWILLAKPNLSNLKFNHLFSDDNCSLSYSIKTEGLHSNNRFYPFIQDDYVIIASGEKTSNKGKEVEIELRLNHPNTLEIGNHTSNIDFVLLTKERYVQKIEHSSNNFCTTSKILET